ncbi:hypothetical protein SBOR_3724 [Sclerotinia borealis F-4128]|uniref:Uncharacterized protein n=1 Tax=Sclerotinia borealis (strain F-4128) TaxID=1432307 RepID=W9CJ78_SCLBF|nr:hypothetical protein SBOR_3724 [Sclerotinia borealis F-4128]
MYHCRVQYEKKDTLFELPQQTKFHHKTYYDLLLTIHDHRSPIGETIDLKDIIEKTASLSLSLTSPTPFTTSWTGTISNATPVSIPTIDPTSQWPVSISNVTYGINLSGNATSQWRNKLSNVTSIFVSTLNSTSQSPSLVTFIPSGTIATYVRLAIIGSGYKAAQTTTTCRDKQEPSSR